MSGFIFGTPTTSTTTSTGFTFGKPTTSTPVPAFTFGTGKTTTTSFPSTTNLAFGTSTTTTTNTSNAFSFGVANTTQATPTTTSAVTSIGLGGTGNLSGQSLPTSTIVNADGTRTMARPLDMNVDIEILDQFNLLKSHLHKNKTIMDDLRSNAELNNMDETSKQLDESISNAKKQLVILRTQLTTFNEQAESLRSQVDKNLRTTEIIHRGQTTQPCFGDARRLTDPNDPRVPVNFLLNQLHHFELNLQVYIQQLIGLENLVQENSMRTMDDSYNTSQRDLAALVEQLEQMACIRQQVKQMVLASSERVSDLRYELRRQHVAMYGNEHYMPEALQHPDNYALDKREDLHVSLTGPNAYTLPTHSLLMEMSSMQQTAFNKSLQAAPSFTGTSLYGGDATTGGLFANKPATTGGLFGSVAPTTQSFLFTSTPATSTTGTGLFDIANKQVSTGFTGFGTPAANTTGKSLFSSAFGSNTQAGTLFSSK